MNSKGFTLFELIIVIIVLGIVASISATSLSTSLRSNLTNIYMVHAINQSTLLFQRLSREFRSMEAGTLTATSCTTGSTTAISFNTTTNSSVQITYSLNSTTAQLMRSDTSSTYGNNSYPIADNVTALSFICLDKNFNPTATASNMACLYMSATVTQPHLSLPVYTLICPRSIL